jgi:prepilin-type N-terminal cleavage/methylation domain-containing protein
LSCRGGLSRGGGLSRRAVTLIELLVTLVILTALIGSTLYAVSTARRVRARNEILTALTLRANSDLARLRAEPWDNLREGTRRLEDPARPDAAGRAEVRDVPGLALKEITVQWRQETPAGPCRVTLATWRDQGQQRQQGPQGQQGPKGP